MALNENTRFNKLLLAYVDVCGKSGKLEEAIDLVTNITLGRSNQSQSSEDNLTKTSARAFHKAKQFCKVLKPHEYISDARIYNRLMLECAKEGKTSRITHLFRTMRSYDRLIQPDLYSYAIVLQSLGCELDKATKKGVHTAVIPRTRMTVERILHDMNKAGFGATQKLAESRGLTYKQRNHISLGIKKIARKISTIRL